MIFNIKSSLLMGPGPNLSQSVVYAWNAKPKRFPEMGLVSFKLIYVQQAIHTSMHLEVTVVRDWFDVLGPMALKGG